MIKAMLLKQTTKVVWNTSPAGSAGGLFPESSTAKTHTRPYFKSFNNGYLRGVCMHMTAPTAYQQKAATFHKVLERLPCLC